jgi:predicted negative regulator of RcsB-dependent stress response
MKFKKINIKLVVYLVVVTGMLTYVLYRYNQSQPPDQAQIERCNQLVSKMPEGTQDEINKNINAFLECLGK